MNCKQGDLAYIIKAIRPENIGKVVQCIECIGFYEQYSSFGLHGEVWWAPTSDYLWVIQNSGSIETFFGTSKEAVIPDSWLRPIKTDPEDLEKTRNEELVTES
jgi:hypothetical protein